MSSMNKQSSAGPDGFSGYLWFNVRNSACLPLSIIFNESMQSDILPDIWKKSVITPIYKIGDRTMYANYRPVALTCVACKIMESLVRDFMMDHFCTKFRGSCFKNFSWSLHCTEIFKWASKVS